MLAISTDKEPTQEANIQELFRKKQGALEEELSAARIIGQPDATGDVTELNWVQFFRGVLPNRYSVRKAFVVDSNGRRSDEIDVVVFDSQYTPLLIEFQNRCFIPSESVYAVFEVKQELSKRTLAYAGEKAESVRALERTSVEFPAAGGRRGPRDLFEIQAGVLTLESSWSPPFGEAFEKHVGALEGKKRLEIGLAFKDGVFTIPPPEDGNEGLQVVETENGLPIFLLRLLGLLRELATVPAMDYEAYLDQIPTD